MSPAPKGNNHNPDGRPLLGDEPRVMLTARVEPQTKATFMQEAAAAETSIGQLLDGVAKRMRANRKRRKT